MAQTMHQVHQARQVTSHYLSSHLVIQWHGADYAPIQTAIQFHYFRESTYQWGLPYLQCISNGDTVFLH